MRLAHFLALVVSLAIATAEAARAGQQYIDSTGFAASGFDVVAFFNMEQSPVGRPQPPAIRGTTLYTFPYNGAEWAFVSEANRDRFAIHPQIYAPQYDGHAAYAAAHGGKVPGNPHLWRIIDGKLYFNITETVVDLWERNIPRHIEMADANWLDIEKNAASALEIPQFDGRKGPILATFAVPPATGDAAARAVSRDTSARGSDTVTGNGNGSGTGTGTKAVVSDPSQ